MNQPMMTIDPGDHVGVIIVDGEASDGNTIKGITLEGEQRNKLLWQLFEEYKPSEVVFEQFALRANMAQKLVGNKFITCEVIGVIKLYCQLKNIKPFELLPSSKEYCGFSANPKDPKYKIITILDNQKITEHVRDAYRLYSYYKLFGKRFNK